MPGSRVVVNHQVMLRGAKGHGAIGRSRILYIANRPGAVASPTEDDLRIRQENECMAKLGYIAYRPGSVAEPNAGHALFDAHGVPARAEIQRELSQTESAIITSVVSVRSGDAAELGLETKQDWERMLRGQWPKYIETLGTMAPENIRWVAAYHIGDKSGIPHCHVFTWDASGQFDSLLPKQKMAQANDELRSHAMRPQREAVSLVRTQSRDELVASMRDMKLEDAKVAEIAQALPAEGSLKYAKLAKFHPEALKPVDAAVNEALNGNAEMAKSVRRFREAVLEHGRIKGLDGVALRAHVDAAEADLRTRLGNACIANVRAAAGMIPERIEPTPEMELRTEVFTLPSERKRLQTLAEELESCLTPEERRALASGLRQLAATGSFPEEAHRALAKASSVRTHPPRFTALGTAGAHRLAASAAQAVGQGGGDFGDDVGRSIECAAMNAAARVLLRAIQASVQKPCRVVPEASLVITSNTP